MRNNYRMSEIDVAGGAAPVLRGRFLYNEPMKKHVSWRAGGAAQRVYIPADLEDLIWLVRSVSVHEDIHMVGLGSNLLVRDGGVAGVVILPHGVLKKLAIESRTHGLPPAPEDIETAVVYAQVGVAAPKLARFSANHNLAGGEFWAGIPGTVGGAIAMNAGCYGSETWDKLVQVQTLDRQGRLNERLPDEYVTGYRHVALKHAHEEWFIGGWFRLARGDGAASRETIKELLKKRIASQPLNLPNAGSVFRNPPGNYAARLIEACGLKGYRIGDAQVSEKHANFIVNLGHATATDIERLIEHVEDSVEAHTNVRLMREVRIIGERQ
ncbi:MAG: UDP-N-acetylmuramate dehydrogenase [Rubrivivax sp.]|nr:UDP-N-acetylmuramate dehydrogenase [Rubrivivax sp.]